MRFGCDGRDAATIYFDLHQRTLRYEVYFLPDPPEDTTLELYAWLLRRKPRPVRRALLDRARRRRVPHRSRALLEHLDEEELDRIIGVLYELVETWFQPALRIAFTRPA